MNKKLNKKSAKQGAIYKKVTTRIRKLPIFAKAILALILLASVAVIISAISVASHYSDKAAKFDIKALDRIQQGTAVLDREGEEIGRIFIENKKILEFDEIPQVMIDALLATEDSRFFEHSGMDLRGIARSAVANVTAMRIKQGASTITQQLTRHVYRLRGKTFDRKLTEIFMARRLEKEYTKEEILTRYVNNIYMGSGFYGMGSAAEGYFGKNISELEHHEAAMLAGIIKSPSAYSPFISPDDALHVRNLSLGRMLALGMISQEEHKVAVEKELGTVEEFERDSSPFFALQAVKRELDRKFDSRNDIDEGRVFTSLDNKLTDATIAAIQSGLHDFENRRISDAGGESSLEGAAVVIENKTGRILAAVGGRNYRTNSFDYAFKGRRTAGTAFLPITYAAYFSEDENRLRGYLLDGPIDNEKVMIGGKRGTLGEWGTLSDEYEGEIPASLAFFQTKTGAALRAGYDTGVEDVITLARELGINSPIQSFPAAFLGSGNLKLIELARAYTAFANEGKLAPAFSLVGGVFAKDGGRITPHTKRGAPVPQGINPVTAKMIRAVMVSRLASPEFDSVLDEFEIGGEGLAGQHGSSHEGRDAWFIGFDREITCAVWVGNIDGSPLEISNPGYELAMPIWAEIMEAATGGDPDGFPDAGSAGQNVCLGSGAIAGDNCGRQAHNGVIPLDSFPRSIRPVTACTIHTSGNNRPSVGRAAVAVVPGSGNGAKFIQPAEPFLAEGDPYAEVTDK